MKRSNLVGFVVTLLLFGFLVPLWKGLDFLDPLLIVISAAIPIVFVAPLVASEDGGPPALYRVGIAVAFSFCLSVLILVNGIATVSFTHRLHWAALPSWLLMTGGLAVNLCGSIFVGLLTTLLMRSFSGHRARRTVRSAFFVILIVFVSVYRFAPPEVRYTIEHNLTAEALGRDSWLLCGILLILVLAMLRPALQHRHPGLRP